MAGKIYEDFLSVLLRVRFQILRCEVQNKNNLLLKINCKNIASMTVSNFK